MVNYTSGWSLPGDGCGFLIKGTLSLIHRATSSASKTGMTPKRKGRPLNNPPTYVYNIQ